MKIAIISDIHGNISALREVMKDIERRKCHVILGLGDYVGYYYWPNQVIDILRGVNNAFYIKGNHENMYFQSQSDSELRQNIKRKYGCGIEVALAELSHENRLFLENLSETQVVSLGGKKIGMFHGSPNDVNEYIYPDAGRDKLDLITSEKLDVILMGHTHYQFISTCNQTLLINPGSVGQSRDVRGLAAYAIYNTSNDSVQPVRVNYDKSLILNKIKNIESDHSSMALALSGEVT